MYQCNDGMQKENGTIRTRIQEWWIKIKEDYGPIERGERGNIEEREGIRDRRISERNGGKTEKQENRDRNDGTRNEPKQQITKWQIKRDLEELEWLLEHEEEYSNDRRQNRPDGKIENRKRTRNGDIERPNRREQKTTQSKQYRVIIMVQ